MEDVLLVKGALVYKQKKLSPMATLLSFPSLQQYKALCFTGQLVVDKWLTLSGLYFSHYVFPTHKGMFCCFSDGRFWCCFFKHKKKWVKRKSGNFYSYRGCKCTEMYKNSLKITSPAFLRGCFLSIKGKTLLSCFLVWV